MTQIIATVSAGIMDAHETDASASYSRISTAVKCSSHASVASRWNNGMRFEGFSSFGGETIDSGYLWVRAQNTSNDDVNVDISAEDTATPDDFDVTEDVTGRLSSKTTASVTWSADGLGIADRVQSPDLQAVVAEVAAIPFTDPILIFCEGRTDGTKNCAWLSFEGTATKRPQLEVNATIGGGGTILPQMMHYHG